MYQSNGVTWLPVFEPDTTLPLATPVPRWSAGLRFIANLVENPLPDLLFEAPFENSATPDTGLAQDSPIYSDPAYGVFGTTNGEPNTISIFSYNGGLLAATAVNFYGPTDTTIPTVPAALFYIVSDTQIIATIPAGIVSGPISVTVPSATPPLWLTPLNFMATTVPVVYSHPGVLAPQLNRVWEIKSDNVDIINLD